jgi:hypothetical protein
MAIDSKEVKHFTADPKTFAVLIQKDRVTKTIAQLDLHSTQCKGFGISVLDGFHRGKSSHAAACNQVYLQAIKARVLSRRIHTINE